MRSPSENPSGRSLEVNGAALYYADYGDGPPLILVHGGLSSSAQWEPVVPELAALGLRRPVVGGWSDGGQVTLELGARHAGVAGALIVGAAYPDFDAGGLREAHRALLGADRAGVPDPAQLEAQLGDFAKEIKALHPGGAEQWRALVRQTAPMWLDYQGLGPDEHPRSTTSCGCSWPAAGTRSSTSSRTSRRRATRSSTSRSAWFKDPSGNVLSVLQEK